MFRTPIKEVVAGHGRNDDMAQAETGRRLRHPFGFIGF
jgi:hypothetical protein